MSTEGTTSKKTKSIGTVDEFRSCVGGSKPTLLVVYVDTKLSETLTEALQQVEEQLPELVVATWDATADQFAEARRTLSFSRSPTIYALHKGSFLDKLEGEADCEATVKSFAANFVGHLKKPAEAEGADDGKTKIDVAKMVNMGKELMGKGQALYAEKFFAKARGVLDALEDDDEDILGSIAMALAWETIAQCVQGKHSDAKKGAERLASNQLAAFNIPNSDVSRAVVTVALMENGPTQWNGKDHSNKALREQLKAEPKNQELRCMLAITLFLSGALEETITEALKLHVTKCDFGGFALDRLVEFLGDDNDLIVRSGWLALKGAQ